jgi:hypothetical protein
VVAVAVDAGWGEDFDHPIEELQGRETQGGAAGQVRFRQDIEDLVGASINQVEAFEGEGPPGTIADQALESGPVGGLDPNAGVEADPTPVIAGEHVLGFVGLQEAVALSRAALVMAARSASDWQSARPSNEAKPSSMKMP